MLIELRSSFLPFLLVLAVLGWNCGHCGASASLDSHGSIPLASSFLHYAIQLFGLGKRPLRRLLCTFSTYLRSLGQQSSWCTLIPVSPTLLLFFGSLITLSALLGLKRFPFFFFFLLPTLGSKGKQPLRSASLLGLTGYHLS